MAQGYLNPVIGVASAAAVAITALHPALSWAEAPTSAIGEESPASVVRELNQIRRPEDEQKRLVRMIRGYKMEESESLLGFLKQRIHIGVGFDEVFNDNVFLRDNNKKEDLISALGGQLLFADPRGSLLYGVGYGARAFRYHRADANAIDHDVRAFLDVDPGGRYQYQMAYRLTAKNTLVQGPEGIDLLRRSSGGDFQRTVTHTWNTKLKYSLNEVNQLVPQMLYSLKDDQVSDDADTDQKLWQTILDLDHAVNPTWTLYGGYGFTDVIIPGDKLKNSEGHGLRLGVRHEVSEIAHLDLLFNFEHREWKSKQQANNFGVEGKWAYQVGPRTSLLVGYLDQQIPSATASRLQFRERKQSIGIAYEATPLTTLLAGASYEKQQSGGGDVITGTTAPAVVSRLYNLGAGLKWQVREQAFVTLDGQYARSKSGDYTVRLVSLKFEMEL
ncbi:MAG: hypothetical protein HYZ93_04505 [Candidatus Omnitrophica bacterium]|nr:hypothetical protein [Candidatus Omnitrophota bacterium]